LNEFHIGWSFTSANGKALKSLLRKISALQPDKTDEDHISLFKAFCIKLPDWFKDKDLQVLDSKFNEIVQQIKDAKDDAPIELFPGGIDVKDLKQKIDGDVKNKGLRWEIGVQGNMDLIENHVYAYAEVGTGLDAGQILSQAGYTDEIRALARTFKKKRMGTLKGKPYLFPNYIKHTANLVNEKEKEIADALKEP